MHLLFEEGVEGAPREDDETSTHNARGLAVLPGVVTKMPKQDEHSLSYKVPHVGWNTCLLYTSLQQIAQSKAYIRRLMRTAFFRVRGIDRMQRPFLRLNILSSRCGEP